MWVPKNHTQALEDSTFTCWATSLALVLLFLSQDPLQPRLALNSLCSRGLLWTPPFLSTGILGLCHPTQPGSYMWTLNSDPLVYTSISHQSSAPFSGCLFIHILVLISLHELMFYPKPFYLHVFILKLTKYSHFLHFEWGKKMSTTSSEWKLFWIPKEETGWFQSEEQ